MSPGKTPTYKSWWHMRERCTNPRCKVFLKYGGRGITMCERWSLFKNFLEDMGERPPGTTIDRIDGSKGYYKDNCRWATPREQAQNLITNIRVTAGGMTKVCAEWSRTLGISTTTIARRRKQGLTVETGLLKKGKIQRGGYRYSDWLVGQQIGWLKVIRHAGKRGPANLWECECVCGATKIIQQGNLTTRGVTSCGCYRKATIKERRERARAYADAAMKELGQELLNDLELDIQPAHDEMPAKKAKSPQLASLRAEEGEPFIAEGRE